MGSPSPFTIWEMILFAKLLYPLQKIYFLLKHTDVQLHAALLAFLWHGKEL